MGDWDPFAVDDDGAGAAPAPVASGTVFTWDDTYEIEGSPSGARVVKRDMDKTIEMVFNRLMKEEPWQEMPDPKPDLSWYKPSCSLEAWKHQDLKCELGEGIVYFTLNRGADGNRLSGSLVAGLLDAIFLLYERKDIRVAVFTGEGKIFCAGGDASGDGGGAFEMAEQPDDVKASRARLMEVAKKAGAFPDGQESMGRLLMTRLWHVWAMVPQFTICVANGSAMGDGLGIVTCCDYAVGLKGSYFEVADICSGVVPAGLAPFIVNKTGSGAAKRIFCTSENMTAEQAMDVGILDEAVDSIAEANQLVAKQCELITGCGPRTVEFAKELVLGVQGQQIIEPLMFYTGMMLGKVSESDEAKAAYKVSAGQPMPWEAKPVKALH